MHNRFSFNNFLYCPILIIHRYGRYNGLFYFNVVAASGKVFMGSSQTVGMLSYEVNGVFFSTKECALYFKKCNIVFIS